MNKHENEVRDSTIEELHRTRELLAEKFGGDLFALAADAQARQLLSGRKIIRKTQTRDPIAARGKRA